MIDFKFNFQITLKRVAILFLLNLIGMAIGFVRLNEMDPHGYKRRRLRHFFKSGFLTCLLQLS